MKKKQKISKLPVSSSKNFKPSDRTIFFILLTIFTIAVILLYDPKLFLGGDNAYYIILAKSLLQGTGFRDIYLPSSPPHTLYPPGFPLLLIPGLIIFRDNFALLKILIILLSLGTFILFYLILKRNSEKRNWLFPLAIFAVSPLILEYSHWILSEIPYLFFTLLAIYLFDRFGYLKKKNIWMFVLTGLIFTFAYFIRSSGVSLILACLAYLFFKKRWRDLFGLAIIMAIFIIFWQLNNMRLGGEVSYIKPFIAKNPYEPETGNITFFDFIARVFTNFKLYTFYVIPQIIFPTLANSVLLNFLGCLSLFFLIIGFIIVIKTKSIGLWEINFILFTLMTLAWPNVWSGDRFLIPILPFILYYLFIGIKNVGNWVKLKPLFKVFFVLMSFLAFVDMAKKIQTNLTNISAYLKGDKYAGYPADWKRYFETLNWIKGNTEKDAIIVSRKPQFTYLLGHRKSIIYQYSSDVNLILKDFYNNKANYLLYDSFYWTGTTRKYVGPVLQTYPDKFELVYKSPPPEMYVFKIK